MPLHYRRSSANYTITLYTTTYPGWEDELRIREGGTIKFAQLDSNLSHSNASYVRVRKDGTTYAVLHTRTGERGVSAGGYGPGPATTNVIEYIDITTTGNGTDFGDLTVSRYGVGSCSNNSNDRGLWGGGFIYPGSTFRNEIDYVAISTTSNATDFGNLTSNRALIASCSNGENNRGTFAGGSITVTTSSNVIDYVTINSPNNATDFGDLTQARYFPASGTSNLTDERGIFAGGGYSITNWYNIIDYITINSAGNAIDFGNLTQSRSYVAASSSGTNQRAVMGGGYYFSGGDIYVNIIDYVTINSTGNAIDFGNLSVSRGGAAAVSNTTRCVFEGGYNTGSTWVNTMDYITMASTGNATDFGDLTASKNWLDGTTNSGGG